jgi:polyferredoxin
MQRHVDRAFKWLLLEVPLLNYAYSVDLVLAGIIGVGLYFHFSGRVWCRFFCPLAALMHVYHRFSRFRILADKKKCISCNVCTAVCHQGIDVMSFANKGEPMADPQCVRCSACVAACPTGVLWFGQVDPRTEREIKSDPAWLAASPVILREIGVNGRPHQL